MKRLLNQVVASFLLLTLFLFNPVSALAVNYGEGGYGEGVYGQGAGSAPGSVGAPTCNDTAPSGPPWLYSAVARDGNSITLYYKDAPDPVTYYALEYGTTSGTSQYSSANIGGKGSGSYTVKLLSPNTTYFFKIRGGNGCATGVWSNELSAKTLGTVSTRQLNTTNVAVTTTPKEKSGTSTSGRQGVPATEDEKPDEGYSVSIKVLNTDQKPVQGAKVEIHSKVQETTTDQNGIARFTNVEQGNHKVVVAYNGYSGEQSLNLTGDVEEFNITITLEQKNVLTSPLVLGIVGGLLAIILALIVMLRRAKRRSSKV